MIKKNIKIIEENRSRQQIISDNIIFYIKKKNMKQSDVYTLLGISKQDFSKKKNNNGSSFNIDEIYSISELLNITVNDLYYTEIEKKEISVLKDKKYSPILAQKKIEIKHLKDSFKDPTSVLATAIGSTIICSIVNYFLVKESPYWILISLLIPLLSFYDFKSSFGIEKTYMINYLDDVYYKIKNVKNKYYHLCFVLHILSILIICICLLLVFNDNFYINYHPAYFILFLIVGVITLGNSIVTLFYNQKMMKQKIYQYEIKGYTSKLITVVNNAVFTVFSINLISLGSNTSWPISLIAVIGLILNIIEFILTSKKYSEYTLVYKKYEEDEIELFPENYEL